MKEQLQQRAMVKPVSRKAAQQPRSQSASTTMALPNHLGNGAVQRMLTQRTGGDGAFDLDDATTNRINQARGSGQAIDGTVQKQMGESMGADFSGVRVHTGGESHALNQQLNAKAFTTGSDIFFRDGAYSPQSSSGQELIAHELTHVVQQGSGVVGGGGGAMKVNAPGDRFEQEADAVSKRVTNPVAAPSVQRATPEQDEISLKRLQRQEMEEEKMPTADADAQPKEEELMQRQAMPEEKEKLEE